MSRFLIEGGNPLVGEVNIRAAKNAVLPIIAAVILTEGETLLRDVPRISDVENLLTILSGLGIKVRWQDGDLHLDTTQIRNNEINKEAAQKIRGSIFVLGSLIGRFRQARLPLPGGCSIGRRPIDLHLYGLGEMGVKFSEANGILSCNLKRGRSAEIYLDFPSVGATENFILASAIGKHTVKIVNAAKEPEVVDLVDFLNKCGACISGAGTDTIIIEGVTSLQGVSHRPIPDRIVAGSFMLAAATVGGDVLIKNVVPRHNANLIKRLRQSGVTVTATNNAVRIITDKRRRSYSAQTGPYPGFPTDIQSQYAVFSCLTTGITHIVENMFEDRFRYVDELRKLGARICLRGKTATFKPIKKFKAGTKEAPKVLRGHELRGSFSLVVASLASEGYSIIEGVEFIDRGYERLEEDFTKLGAKIIRI
ncbi:MAG: UDP-N-acetylglucosamine 1-carboxyvinyltransferase [Firmicutes bacterium]|nr:UDP-N-acetylglucosamine 1-carboxyvinyltransferase [Bacillota bacterium]